MTAEDATDTRTAAVRALLDFAACLPFAWEWRSVPVLRLAVRDDSTSAETLVSVEAGRYIAEVETGVERVPLAPVGRPGEAVAALARETAAVIPS